MSNDNTLDDLILTEPEPEKTKSRGLLALLALVILLIIVGAILAKMIFSAPDEPTKAKDDTKVEVASDISPDIDKIDANTKDSNSKDSNISSDLAPITADPDLAPLNDNAIAANVDTVDVDENKNAKNKSTKSSNNLAGDSSKVANEEDSLGVAPVGKTSTVKKEEDVPKRVVVKEKPAKKETKVVHKNRGHLIGGSGNVYIQVGSFTKGPERSFIRKITRAGFKYRIRTQNGYRRVYVGPFASRKEAARYLGRVRSEINPQAFIK
jgi:cell division protein FtsN